MQATTILNTLIQILFSGFALWSIILPFLLLFIKKPKVHFIKEIDLTALRIIQFAGILFICQLLIYVLSLNTENSQIITNRMFGKYWFAFWTFPFAYFFLTQLLWFKKIKDNVFLRIIIAIVILFALYIEKFVILLASLQTPDIQGIATGGSISIQAILIDGLIDGLFKLILFSTLALLIHFVIHTFKKKPNSNEN